MPAAETEVERFVSPGTEAAVATEADPVERSGNPGVGTLEAAVENILVARVRQIVAGSAGLNRDTGC